jgi:hypothetical protein
MMKGSVIFLVVSWVRKGRGRRRRRCVVGRDVDECLKRKRFGGGGGSILRCVTKDRDTCLRVCSARTRASCVSVRVGKTWGIMLG